MEVHYCHVCGTKVSSDAIDGGNAMRSAANRIICSACVRDLKPAGAELPRAVVKKVLPRRDEATVHSVKKGTQPQYQGMAYFLGAVVMLIAGMLVFFAPAKISPSSNAQSHAEKPPAQPNSIAPVSSPQTKLAAAAPAASESKPQPVANSISRDALLSYWTFDELTGDTVKDTTGNGHDGVLVNEPLSTPGKFGAALGFFGKQYVLVKKPETLEMGASSFTFVAWMKTRGAGCILSKTQPTGGWADHGKIIFVGEGSGRLRMDSHGVADNSGSSGVIDNNWHHIAVSFLHDKKVMKLFVDGKEDGSYEMQLEADPGNFEIRLGYGPSTSHTLSLTGLLDDVAFYGRVLKHDEIEALGNGSKRP